MDISLHAQPAPEGAKFSILVPTWNNLAYAQACVASLRKHSHFTHQIVLHINEGSDGTPAWAESEGLAYSLSPENVGVCHALNAAAGLAKTDYICFFNDDMVALPDWDLPLWKEIESLDHDRWFLSGTMVEPTDTGNPCVIAPKDFGRSVAEFREVELIANFRNWHMEDWSGATWPPNVVPKSLWDEVGGYSEEFSPGMSSDPDFSMKLWSKGVRYFKGIAASRVYHFQARSTGKVVKNDGRKQFLHKWGMTQSTFGKYYLRRGEKWNGALPEPSFSLGLLFGRIKSWFKRQLG
jgi:glycosyltransferase involved in cell wall biosynthesis